MPASIFGTRFAGLREPAWHGLGTVFTDAPTATEAAKRAGLDYTIGTFPLSIPTPWGDVGSSGKIAIVREPVADDPAPAILGYAGSDYEVVQNLAIAAMLDPLVSQYPVETVGALGRSETVFFTLTAGSGEIAGEEIARYFLVTDTRTGIDSFKMAYTPVRVVCANTLAMGLSQAVVTASIPHTPGLAAEAEFRLTVLKGMQAAQDRVDALLGRLAQTKIVDDQVNDIIKAAYPDQTKSRRIRLVEELREVDPQALLSEGLSQGYKRSQDVYDWARERTATYRVAAKGLYLKFCDEYPALSGTAWAGYNAVVECEDYRVHAATERAERSAAAAALFGDRVRAKVRAFEKALTFCPN